MRGITLRLGRVRRGLSQTDLAQKLGLQQTDISKVERGIFQLSPTTASYIREIFREIDNGNGDGDKGKGYTACRGDQEETRRPA